MIHPNRMKYGPGADDETWPGGGEYPDDYPHERGCRCSACRRSRLRQLNEELRKQDFPPPRR